MFSSRYIIYIASLFVLGCTANSAEKDETKIPTTLPVISLKTQTTPIYHEYVGDVQALNNVEIFSRVKGYLEHIYVDEGKPVKKGQLLFRINDGEYKAEYASAKAALSHAIAEAKEMELEADRVRSMVDKQVISKTEWEVANARLSATKAKIEEAQSALANASIRLAHTRVTAPFDGIIDRIPYKPGSLIDEGTPLTTISDLHEVYAYFNVSENEYLEYAKGKIKGKGHEGVLVELILADGEKHATNGVIETLEGQFNESTGSIAFRAKFTNPHNLLKHGSTGTVRLTSSIENALIVPQKASFEIQDKNFVYVVDSTNQVKMRSFTPKLRYSHYYIVASGLKVGEKIVYEGVQSVKDGMKIIPKNLDFAGTEVSLAK